MNTNGKGQPPYGKEDSLSKYLEEIGGFLRLTASEEIALARRIRKGDEEALDKLVKHNLRFVISVAKEYQGQGLPLQDLISEGNLGLIKAAQRFDETRGFKFISYAVWWIRQSIMQALAEQSRVVRLPLNLVGAINRVGHALEALEKEYGREPSLDEIATRMGKDHLDIAALSIQSKKAYHLDAPFSGGKDGDNSLLGVIKSDSFSSPDSGLMSSSMLEDIEAAVASLRNPREQEIIRLYFGLNSDRPLTLDEIGERFSLTRERVRQIKEKALRRLRHPSRQEPLRAHLG